MQNVAIILVEPIYGGNVGAIARIMNNFRFGELRIVGKVPEKNDFYLAVHSEHILENVKTYPDLAAAIGDLDRVIAFSRRIGKTKPVDMSPRKAATFVHQIPHLKIGLIFGRETFGLTDDEADLCPLRCHIPANPDFPSINLAQAVGLICWELYSYPIEQGDSTRKLIHAAELSEIEKLRSYILEVMEAIGFFRSHETTNWERFWDNILHQLNPSKNMLYRLRQLFNRIHVLVLGKGKGYHS